MNISSLQAFTLSMYVFAGCCAEVFGSSLASFQVLDLITQVQRYGAVSNSYSVYTLKVYYWVGILSIAFSVYIFLMCSLLSSIVG